MEATGRHLLLSSGVLLISLISIFGAGCDDGSSGTVNAPSSGQCVAQAQSDSFLVQWKESIPADYEHYRVSPTSLVTRFVGVSKKNVEDMVLRNHLGEYIVAEHEFRLTAAHESTTTLPANSVMVQGCHVENQNTLPASWGVDKIRLSQAWSYLGKQGEGVIVGVIDSGVDMTHPLLSSRIYRNSREIPGNGVDDDGNGYVDDVNGYNFASNNNDATDRMVLDTCGHGTHVSGIIAGAAGPNGFTGVAPKATILPLKFFDNDAAGNPTGGLVGDAVRAMEYALNQGARVINASWGGDQCSDVLKNEIGKVTARGVVMVVAAGNGDSTGRGLDISITPEWPAVYQFPGKITVASTGPNDYLSQFSNYGILVDLAGPGENIVSPVPAISGLPDTQLGVKSGTSMATPYVAGVAALLLSARPNASAIDIANAINNSVVSGNFGVRTRGRLDAYQAAQYLISH